MPEQDRQELERLVLEVYHLVEQVTFVGGWIGAELLGDFEEAWRHVGGAVLETREWLSSPGSEESLDRAGLSGPQLALKLHGYRSARDRFRSRPGRRALRSVLRWANVILGSLAAVFPPAEPLKELKEALEAELADREAGL